MLQMPPGGTARHRDVGVARRPGQVGRMTDALREITRHDGCGAHLVARTGARLRCTVHAVALSPAHRHSPASTLDASRQSVERSMKLGIVGDESHTASHHRRAKQNTTRYFDDWEKQECWNTWSGRNR
jgi:hypothetical protein